MRARRAFDQATDINLVDVGATVALGSELLEIHAKTKPTVLQVALPLRYGAAILVTTILAFALKISMDHDSRPLAWWILLAILSIPAILTFAVVLGFGSPLPHQQWIAAASVGMVLGHQLPATISTLVVFMTVTIFHLASRPKSKIGSENKARLQTALAAMMVAMVLLVENFFVWVVAATYEPGITGSPVPLQDNLQILQRVFLSDILGLAKSPVVAIRSILNVQWALTASLSVSFGVIELQMVSGRTLWGMALRVLFMLAALRAIRVCSFLMTVLPSQTPDCYRQRFPVPPPTTWWAWIEVGLRPASHGGCNDLIVSGHATILTTFCCAATSVAGHPLITAALWSMLVIDFMLEIYEGYHYSVDMWLGGVIGCLIWRILAPCEEAGFSSTVGQSVATKVQRQLHPLSSTTMMEVVMYAVPAVVAYVDIVFVPHKYKAYPVVGILLFCAVQAARNGHTHLLQHSLFCLMFLALGVWL